MKVIIFGATGMVGQGVLRECLSRSEVTQILTIGRTKTGISDSKLIEIEHGNLWDYSTIEYSLTGFDACFFCLGVSVSAVTQADFVRLNYDLPIAAGRTLSKLNPQMTMVYVSGEGTDSTEKGDVFWARVKGKTENDLMKMPFKAAYMFRPGAIFPKHGEKSKTPLYRNLILLLKPLLYVARELFPKIVLDTQVVARAMIAVTMRGYEKKILRPADISFLGESLL